MKVIFLDIDGVLNSEKSLMSDDSLEDALILNLKTLVKETNAKIILSSSWRCLPSPLRTLMDKLDRYDLYLSGLTPNGVSIKWLKAQGYTPTRRYLDEIDDYEGNSIQVTMDRGAEILKWLSTHENVESFVIFDDDTFDITPYFFKNVVKTNFQTGLSLENIELAKRILLEKETGNEN